MRRLTRHIADLIEDTNSVSHGDVYWLETLISFREGRPGRSVPAKTKVTIKTTTVAMTTKVAHMFDSSGLAGVLLGEEHFPALEQRKIHSIHLVDHHARMEGGRYPNELVMGIPSYPANWKY